MKSDSIILCKNWYKKTKVIEEFPFLFPVLCFFWYRRYLLLLRWADAPSRRPLGGVVEEEEEEEESGSRPPGLPCPSLIGAVPRAPGAVEVRSSHRQHRSIHSSPLSPPPLVPTQKSNKKRTTATNSPNPPINRTGLPITPYPPLNKRTTNRWVPVCVVVWVFQVAMVDIWVECRCTSVLFFFFISRFALLAPASVRVCHRAFGLRVCVCVSVCVCVCVSVSLSDSPSPFIEGSDCNRHDWSGRVDLVKVNLWLLLFSFFMVHFYLTSPWMLHHLFCFLSFYRSH